MEKPQSFMSQHRLNNYRLGRREIALSELLNGMAPHITCAFTVVKWQYIDNLLSRLPVPQILFDHETYTVLKGQEFYNSLLAYHQGLLTMPEKDPSLLFDFVAGQSFSSSNLAYQRRFEESSIPIYFVGHGSSKEIVDIISRRFPNP